MDVRSLLSEYDLEIDDVKWYLCVEQADRLLSYAKMKHDLTRLIWSGKLEAELYHMDERFLDELQEKLDRRLLDEAEVRKTFNAIQDEKRKRR